MDVDDGRLPRRDGRRLSAPTASGRLRVAWLAGTTALAAPEIALAQAGALEAIGHLRFDPQNAVGMAFAAGLVVFSTTLALIHMRERRRSAEREGALRRELDTLRGAQERNVSSVTGSVVGKP